MTDRHNKIRMFKTIGTIFLLYAISQMLPSSFGAFDRATTATFTAVEIAANVSQEQLREIK